MNKKNLIAVILLTVAVSSVVFLNFAKTKTKSYYSGDAIQYNGQLVIASANTGYLEIYKFKDGKLANVAKLASPIDAQVKSYTFNDVLFNIENDRLYVYATSGSTLYKYDFSDLTELVLAGSTRDTTWDWFGHLGLANGHVITSGNKAVKIWNDDLQVIDSYKIKNDTNPYNIRFDDQARFIFNINGAKLEVFDRGFRQVNRTISLVSNLATGNKQAYFDGNMLYVADDESLKKMSIDGDIYKTKAHNSKFGYDVVASVDEPEFIYFSNGSEVTKLNKNDFSQVAKFSNSKFNIANSWAMGLKLVDTIKGEVVVVFNNSNILVLDKNLQPFATVLSTEEDLNPLSGETLSLKTDRNSGVVWTEVGASGQGFGPNEDISLIFAGTEYSVKADDNGRFETAILVPQSAKAGGNVELRATGKTSKRTYSTTFWVIK